MKNIIVALSLVLSLSVAAQPVNVRKQINEARSIAQSWMALQAQGTSQRDLFPGQPERSSLIITGIPKFIKLINPDGRIFRHYIGANMATILETSQLKTGITPYVVVNPGISREVYDDLIGIFLTNPETAPEIVGLPRNSNADYIDFTLYVGTPVVEIEPEILVIPGRPDVPQWLKKMYFEYKRTGNAEPTYLSAFEKLDKRGDISPTFMKVKIIEYRMNGRRVRL